MEQNMRVFLTAAIIGASLIGTQAIAADADLLKQAQGLFSAIPAKPPELKDNPATPAKLELGKALFFEPRMSKSHSISCASCHSPATGGDDELETSIGHKWQIGGRNAPTVLNSVFNTAQFWDGRAKDLETQAAGPIANPAEMASSASHAIEMLKKIPGYRPLFEAAFPGETDPVTIGNVTKAIAVFEATLVTPDAPFDKYLKGDEAALSEQQKAGLKLFIDKGCAGCHDGVNVGGRKYAPFGVIEKPGAQFLPPADKGRFEVTKTVSDEYVFKVPSLRNIVLTAPYFHTGKAWDLRQAVAVMGAAQLGAKLSDGEVNSIVAFLDGLTGEQPKVTLPILPPSTAETPKPER
jgi:cytochrome c peroxidase